MSNYLLQLVLVALGGYLFLFIFWRNLSEDYPDKRIFLHGFGIVLGALLGAFFGNLISASLRSSSLFDPKYFFWWGTGIGLVTGLIRTSRVLKLSLVQLLEYSLPGILLWFAVINFLIPIHAISLMLLLGLFYLTKAVYRKFTWYKSGKVGFASFLTLGVFFSLRAVIAATAPSMVSSVGKVETVLAACLAFLCFWSIYQLSDV